MWQLKCFYFLYSYTILQDLYVFSLEHNDKVKHSYYSELYYAQLPLLIEYENYILVI
jgi:hypothetical protein